MDANDVLTLGLGISPPWKLVAQRLDTDKGPALGVAEKKDIWDILSSLSMLISGGLIAAVGVTATIIYDNRQLDIPLGVRMPSNRCRNQ